MEFILLLPAAVGLCARLGRALDARDRLTRCMLEGIAGAAPIDDPYAHEEGHGLMAVRMGRTPRRPPPPKERQESILRSFLRVIGLSHEAFPHKLQLRCLTRCVDMRWAIWDMERTHLGNRRLCTLRLTPAGIEELERLRNTSPPALPAARLLSS